MGVSYICPLWIYVENYMLTATVLFNYESSYNEIKQFRSTPTSIISCLRNTHLPLLSRLIEETMIRVRTMFFYNNIMIHFDMTNMNIKLYRFQLIRFYNLLFKLF